MITALYGEHRVTQNTVEYEADEAGGGRGKGGAGGEGVGREGKGQRGGGTG